MCTVVSWTPSTVAPHPSWIMENKSYQNFWKYIHSWHSWLPMKMSWLQILFVTWVLTLKSYTVMTIQNQP